MSDDEAWRNIKNTIIPEQGKEINCGVQSKTTPNSGGVVNKQGQASSRHNNAKLRRLGRELDMYVCMYTHVDQ